MASLRLINRIIPSRSFSCVRKTITSAATRWKKSRSFMSFVPRGRNGYLPSSLSFSRVCGCGIHNAISEGIAAVLMYFSSALVGLEK